MYTIYIQYNILHIQYIASTIMLLAAFSGGIFSTTTFYAHFILIYIRLNKENAKPCAAASRFFLYGAHRTAILNKMFGKQNKRAWVQILYTRVRLFLFFSSPVFSRPSSLLSAIISLLQQTFPRVVNFEINSPRCARSASSERATRSIIVWRSVQYYVVYESGQT